MTPLSLELIRDALFTGADQVATMLPLDEKVRDNVRRRQLAIFGHRFYQNVSVLGEMASAMPGQTPEDFNHQINGEPYPEGYVRPRFSLRDGLGYLKFAGTAGPRLAGIGAAVSEAERRTHEIKMDADALGALPDERLSARIEMLWDDCIAGWKVGLLCTFLVSAPTAMLERRYGSAAVTQPQGHGTQLGQFPSAPGREGTIQASPGPSGCGGGPCPGNQRRELDPTATIRPRLRAAGSGTNRCGGASRTR